MHGCIIPALRDKVDVVGVDVSITKRQAGDTFSFYLFLQFVIELFLGWNVTDLK